MSPYAVKVRNGRNLEAFVWSGCFDDFGVSRTNLWKSIKGALEYANLARDLGDAVPKSKYVQGEELSFIEQLNKEKGSTWLLFIKLSDSAICEVSKRIRNSISLRRCDTRKSTKSYVYITSVRVIRTKSFKDGIYYIL